MGNVITLLFPGIPNVRESLLSNPGKNKAGRSDGFPILRNDATGYQVRPLRSGVTPLRCGMSCSSQFIGQFVCDALESVVF